MLMNSCTVSLNGFYPDMLRLDFDPMQEETPCVHVINDNPSTAMTVVQTIVLLARLSLRVGLMQLG